MADIFVSYKREDKERIRGLVDALEQQGWSVFWDRQLEPHTGFRKVIAENL
ncbi:MAG: TIR domain-containing protein, partial [Blastocatellia bacterium]